MDIKELETKVEELGAEVIRLRDTLKSLMKLWCRSKHSSLYEDED